MQKKHFPPLRMLYSVLKSCVNFFVSTRLTFTDRVFFFNLYVFCCICSNFLLMFFSYYQNLYFLRNKQYAFGSLKLVVLILQQIFLTYLAKFLSINTSFIVIMIKYFLFNFINFCVVVSFLTKSLVSIV